MKKRAKQQGVEDLLQTALKNAEIVTEKGFQVRVTRLKDIHRAVDQNPILVFDLEFIQIFIKANCAGRNAGEEALAKVCCTCGCALSLKGNDSVDFIVHFKPLGKANPGWQDQSVLVFGCTKCSLTDPHQVYRNACEAVMGDLENTTTFEL